VARDRKQRSRQRSSRGASGKPDGHGGDLVRSDVPGALDHASGDVDEFDAAIVRGAGGVPLEQGEQPAPEEAEEAGESNGVVDESARAGSPSAPAPAERRAPAAAEPKRSLLSRVVPFLRASWAELQRVQWPDRRHVFQATAVVLGFVVVAGLYLGAADWVAQKIVNFIL
jgi:preprotein translocase subunit SecE